MSQRDPEDDELDDDLDDEEESPAAPKVTPKAALKADGSSSKAGPSSRAASATAVPTTIPSSRALLLGIGALALGGIAGWFGHIQKVKAAVRADVAAAPTGSGVPAGPCGAWQAKICASAGAQSAPCQEAKGAATDLLLPSTCETALGTMTETLAKVKAARASCDKLVTKICKDLSPGSKTCDMVKERTASFPPQRCDQMLTSYDKVIGELKQMDQQGGMPMGGPQRMPAGMPHGATPHVALPSGTP